jgi:hypothetical protein
MKIFQVSLPDFYQIGTEDQTAVMSQLVSLFAGPLQHCRLLTIVMPADLTQLEQQRRKLAMSRHDDLTRRGLLEEVRLISGWDREGGMRHTQHYLLDFNDTLTANDLAHWRVQSKPAFPQLPITGDYAEYTDHMAPVLPKGRGSRWQIDHSRYRYGILASYQLTRTWDWRHPLAQLVTGVDLPFMLCIDIRKLHPERVTASAEFWQGMVLNGQDRQAILAQQEAESALNVRHESVHHVRVLLMVLDKQLKNLRERLDSLHKTSTQYMQVDPLKGYQAAAAQLFTPIARPAGLPKGHFNTLSRAPALFAGVWGVGREQKGLGYYMGISVDEIAPHVHYLDWQGNDPFHGIILGRTGKGKTVAAQAMAWRMVEQDVQAILLEPQGHSQRLRQLAGNQHCSYHQLSYETTTLNILDVVYENPSDQFDHVITLLGLLLNPMGHLPRHFTNAEVAALRQALHLVYALYQWQEELLGNPEYTPTLESLCHQLNSLGTLANQLVMLLPHQPHQTAPNEYIPTAALRLAQEIQSLYVEGDYAGTFNTATNLDLTLKERLVLFDFSRVPERRRALFYYATLAGIHLQVRRHPRKRAIFVDEVHYMNQEATLMNFMANMVKTVRTYGAAVVLIDQDLEAFIGVEGAQAESMATGLNVTAGQFVINNVSWTLAFGMKRSAAYRLADHYKEEILPSHAEFLAQMGSEDQHGKGMAVVRANGKADRIYFQLRPMEAQHLFGS